MKSFKSKLLAIELIIFMFFGTIQCTPIVANEQNTDSEIKAETPLDRDTFIKAALTRAIERTGQEYNGRIDTCSAFVKATMADVGAEISGDFLTYDWFGDNVNQPGRIKYVYNDKEYVPVYLGQNISNRFWYEGIENIIQPGDIITSYEHMYIFLMKVDISDIKAQYPLPPYMTQEARAIEQRCIDKINEKYFGGVSDKITADQFNFNVDMVVGDLGSDYIYLYVEGNQATEEVKIRNYNWYVNREGCTMSPMKVYRIATEKTRKTIKVTWDDSDNENGIRPSQMTVKLYADNEQIGDPVVLNSQNSWTYTWINLEKQSEGEDINYEIRAEGNIAGYDKEVTVRGNVTTISNSINIEDTEIYKGSAAIHCYEDMQNNGIINLGTPVSGMEFKLATTRENAENGIFIQDGEGNDVIATTNEYGIAEFQNLDFNEEDLEAVKYIEVNHNSGKAYINYHWDEISTKYYGVATNIPNEYKNINEIIEVDAVKDYQESSLVQVKCLRKKYDLAINSFVSEIIDGSTGSSNSIESPVQVHTTDLVTYTLQIINEGEEDAYASKVKCAIPEGLEFVQFTENDGSINDTYNWIMVDENDVVVTNPKNAKYVVTDYLAKGIDDSNLIGGFNEETMSIPNSRFVNIQFKVGEPTSENRTINTITQIMEVTDSIGQVVNDFDSTPNRVLGEDDEAIVQIRVYYFHLGTTKWVTQAIIIDNGRQTIHETGHTAETDANEVVKIDIDKDKINDVMIKIRYKIRITNEGEVAGQATEISNFIPEGLKFLKSDNPNWQMENGIARTSQLAGTVIEPGKSVELDLVLTWINGAENMGVIINPVEITKDENEYNTPDKNNTSIEKSVISNDKKTSSILEDKNDAPVIITVKTGKSSDATLLILGVVIIMTGGIVGIKKYVLN